MRDSCEIFCGCKTLTDSVRASLTVPLISGMHVKACVLANVGRFGELFVTVTASAPCGAGHPSSPLVHLLPHLFPFFTFLFLSLALPI